MSMRSEIEEDGEALQREQQRREDNLSAIIRFANQRNIDLSEEEKDKILHPENYDDFGNPKRFL